MSSGTRTSAILYNVGHHSQILLAARGSAFVKCQDTDGLA